MGYDLKLKVKNFRIEAGKMIVVLNIKDANELGVLPNERVEVIDGKAGNFIAVVDITEKAVKVGEIGVFSYPQKIKLKERSSVVVKASQQPKSVEYIKKKMDGIELTKKEIYEIVQDLAKNKLSEIEASAFISSVYINGFNLEETANMTKALIDNGQTLKLSKSPVVDKHSVGGINGRATMIIVPIIASTGLYMPKTSSRSITSAAGTADAMEVIAPVNLSIKKIKTITEKYGGVLAWGGAVELAPADDKIIKLEHPLSLDPEGQVIASVLAKKASVGSKFVVIDLPVGKYAKIKDKKQALRMAKKFVEVGKRIGMEVEAVITNGEEPSGLAFGPALETQYAMEILEGKIFDNLAQKSCELAGAVLELAGKCRQGKGYYEAREILHSGKALKKMYEIIKAQGGKVIPSEKIFKKKYSKEVYSSETGAIAEVNIKAITKIARVAGAPANKHAGVMLNKFVGEKINKDELLYTIYAENRRKLDSAIKQAKELHPISFERIILSRIR